MSTAGNLGQFHGFFISIQCRNILADSSISLNTPSCLNFFFACVHQFVGNFTKHRKYIGNTLLCSTFSLRLFFFDTHFHLVPIYYSGFLALSFFFFVIIITGSTTTPHKDNTLRGRRVETDERPNVGNGCNVQTSGLLMREFSSITDD